MGEHRTKPAIAPWRGWGPLVVLPAAVVLFTPSEWPRWVFMWLLGWTVFTGCKWLTWRRTPAPSASIGRHLGYLLAWPGLDASAFLCGDPLSGAQRPRAAEWAAACAKLALGAILIWGVVRLLPADAMLLRGWVAMIGISMALHFGVFHVLSCAWRTAGVDARPLMNWPVMSTGVSEFWGRRWNMAFRDLTHRFLFRPLAARLGPRGALIAGFIFSGFIHELVISVPAGAGYGGPTLFFALQVPAMLIERGAFGKKVGLGRGWRGWLFTAIVLIAPAGLLFHPPFVRDVVLPFVEALGA